MGVRNKLVATDKELIRKDGKVIASPVRIREEKWFYSMRNIYLVYDY